MVKKTAARLVYLIHQSAITIKQLSGKVNNLVESRKIGKRKDLSNFDKGQIVIGS